MTGVVVAASALFAIVVLVGVFMHWRRSASQRSDGSTPNGIGTAVEVGVAKLDSPLRRRRPDSLKLLSVSASTENKE